MDPYSDDVAASSNNNHDQSSLPPQPCECAHIGCGFFGTAENKGFCSQHYKAYLKEKMAQTEPATPPAINKNVEQVKVSVDTAVSSLASLNLKGEVEQSTPPTPVVKNRCQSCNKKTGLLGFSCRCGGNYCGLHRYAEKHSCSFDFKAVGKSKIEKDNPLVQASKLTHRL